MIFVWEWNVLTHSYAFVTRTRCLGTSSISANATLCKSPVSRVTAELVPVLWSSPLAKILQLGGFKQNSVMKRSTRKGICGPMLLLGKLPAPVGHWPPHGDTEVAMKGHRRGCDHKCSQLMGFWLLLQNDSSLSFLLNWFERCRC